MSYFHAFAYESTDIPEGMTVREWALAGRPKVCPPVAGVSLRPEPEQGLGTPATPLDVDPDAGLVW